ncbi:MAG: HEPN domain-containing protein [Actinobacteria bacterium]|nr:HEPN domain-containing protein [Actinomycetota bacterium]
MELLVIINLQRKLFSGKNKFLDTAVFHCQQAIEKILKSFLVHKGIKFEKVHNIVYLLDKCVVVEESFQKWYPAAETVTPYATLFRYPGDYEEPEIEDVEEALKYSKEIINFVLDIYMKNKEYLGRKL